MFPDPKPLLNVPEADGWCRTLSVIAAALSDIELDGLAGVCWALSVEIELAAHPPKDEDA